MPYARLILLLVGLGASSSAHSLFAQDLVEPAKERIDAIQKVQNLMTEPLIEPKDFRAKLQLGTFVESMNRQWTDKRITVRMDKEAFGDKYAEVAALPLVVPAIHAKLSLLSAFHWYFASFKNKIDFRVSETEITITTPERALYTMVYDIRELASKPEVVGLADPRFRNAGQTKRAMALMKRALTLIEPLDDDARNANHEAIQILNGTRVVIRATGTRNAEFAQLFQVLARLSDLAVITTTKLYEVDDVLYTKIKNAKHVPIEELERQFLEAKAPKGETLFDVVAKQKPILVSPDVKVNVGHEVTLLSRHDVIRCLPSPDQILKKDMTRQTVLDGVAFTAVIGTDPTRRVVLMKFVETAQQPEIRKVKVREHRSGLDIEEFGKEPPRKDVFGEVAFLKESNHTRTLEIPDGGTMLVPVHHQPRSVEQKNRWWVLAITPRIYMEEEERMIKMGEKK